LQSYPISVEFIVVGYTFAELSELFFGFNEKEIFSSKEVNEKIKTKITVIKNKIKICLRPARKFITPLFIFLLRIDYIKTYTFRINILSKRFIISENFYIILIEYIKRG
jgi:hypothetical protein